jgi:hypothetical protein
MLGIGNASARGIIGRGQGSGRNPSVRAAKPASTFNVRVRFIINIASPS